MSCGKCKDCSCREELIKRADELAADRFEYELSRYVSQDFVEITGNTGGDIRTYRIYNNYITER